MVQGLRSSVGAAAPPFTRGPYTWDQQVTFSQGLGTANTPGNIYYVNRKSGTPGDGKSWGEAFLTIGEAISAVNSDYANAVAPSSGRNRVIYIAEGWYGEVPLTLTANDVHIIALAPGNHDSTVLYGSATAGGFDTPSGGPALTITGSNNTIENLGIFTHDPLFASLQLGALATNTVGNKVLNCSFVRDVDDGSLYGILDYGYDGTLIENCFFSTSCKDAGVYVKTDGVNNPVNSLTRGCRFVGVPIGVQIQNGSGSVEYCTFASDYSDRPGTMATPIVINASGTAHGNICGVTNKAGIVTGSGTIVDAGNMGSDGLIGQT